jgi:iron(III) transport system ATP-binding protein
MLTVRDLTKIYANRFDAQAGGVREVSFDLPDGTFFTLLGPSGCGKTTTLRCVAGLERPDAGVIAVGDRVLFDSARGVAVPLNERGIGMVFQSYAIWPHMTVFENIAFPLRVAKGKRRTREDIRSLVDQALSTVGLGGYGDRPATRLSGGQQQRVALARAIVHRPRLLLLDEPLSNLDAALREEMRIELRRLQQQIGVTTIYVTHDQSEALAMSDRIAVMDKGRVVQIGDPREIYFRPANEFVASFIGAANLLSGICDGAVPAGAMGAVRLGDGSRIHCLFPAGGVSGHATTVSVRPESIVLATGPCDETALRGVVNSASFLGGSVRYDVQVGDIVVRVVGQAEQVVPQGTAVGLTFPASSAVSVG